MSLRISRATLPLTAACLLSLALVPAACSNEPEFGDGVGQGGDRGTGSDPVLCLNPELADDCGRGCSATDDCPDGLFCHATTLTCQANCVAGEEESEDCDGAACSADGLCPGDDSSVERKSNLGVEGGGGAGTGGDVNEECIDVEVDFEPIIPNVVLLIDQSGSMNDGSGFGTAVQAEIDDGSYTPWGCGGVNDLWRWNVVRSVLFNPDGGIVKPLEDQVRFGMALYTSNGGFGLTEPFKTCPVLAEVALGFGTYAEMLEAMDCSDIGSDTPTRESLRDTAAALAARELDGKNVIVLATDGEPDNCTCPNWNDDGGYDCDGDVEDRVTRPGFVDPITLAAAEQYDVVQEAKRVYEELGIQVFVIDVSTPSNTSLRDHLTDVAEAGGGDIFDGTNPSGLTDAFQTIIDGARSCAIDLDGEIEDGKESTGKVLLNGDPLTLGDPDGWKVNSPTQIELVGDACTTIKSGAQELDITFPCGAFSRPVTK
jgi:hypothetical protein